MITSDFFGRKDMLPGLGPAPQFMDAVFTAADKVSADLASASQGVAVFQLLEIKPPATPTFEEVRTKIEEEFKNERAQTLLVKRYRSFPTARKLSTISSAPPRSLARASRVAIW